MNILVTESARSLRAPLNGLTGYDAFDVPQNRQERFNFTSVLFNFPIVKIDRLPNLFDENG